jgi:hypothetical protein
MLKYPDQQNVIVRKRKQVSSRFIFIYPLSLMFTKEIETEEVLPSPVQQLNAFEQENGTKRRNFLEILSFSQLNIQK